MIRAGFSQKCFFLFPFVIIKKIFAVSMILRGLSVFIFTKLERSRTQVFGTSCVQEFTTISDHIKRFFMTFNKFVWKFSKRERSFTRDSVNIYLIQKLFTNNLWKIFSQTVTRWNDVILITSVLCILCFELEKIYNCKR